MLREKYRQFSKSAIRTIDRMSLTVLFVFTIGTVLGYGFLYLSAGHFGNGPTNGQSKASLWDCFYFSAVTFSSLGYGDVVPHGFSKVIACSEVFIGLGFLGVFFAKLSSAKQSYQLAQLYARDVQQRLHDFSILLEGHANSLKNTLEVFKRQERLEESLMEVQSAVYVTSFRIRGYLSFEIRNADILTESQIGAPARLLKRSTKVVSGVSALTTFPQSLHTQNLRKVARRTVQEFAAIGRLVRENASDAALQSEAGRLVAACTEAEQEIIAVYNIVAEQYDKPKI